MRLAYLDCFSGISGDMFLAALVDAGVPAHLLEETARALQVGAELKISRVDRSGISAAKVDVVVGEKSSGGSPVSHDPHPHGHTHAHGRHLGEIKKIIAAAAISDPAKRRATAIFEALGAAEAKVHNVPVEKIHFHEVGAADAIVDIVCAAVGSEALGVDDWVCSPLNVGGGTVECAHGTFPVPAPAVIELLKGAPVFSSGLQAELVTPTGAAIVTTLASRFAPIPSIKIERSGYGAGSRDFKRHANVCRILVGEIDETQKRGVKPEYAEEAITILEANIDDMSPEVFGYVAERALEAGALDVFTVPIQMKKGRPGMLLSVLCKPGDAAALMKLMFSETTTLGIRGREERRAVLARRVEQVETRWGAVRMKVANLNGTIANFAPEYEDCRRLAAEHHIPLKTVMQEAMAAWREREASSE